MKENKDLHICFVTPFAASFLTGNGFKGCGGAELQQVLIAKSLKSKVKRISFIVSSRYQNVKKNSSFEIVPCHFRYFGGSNVFFVKDSANLFLTLKALNPDIVLYKTPKSLIYTISLYGKLSKTKIIKLIAHDNELSLKGKWFSNLLYKLCLKAVDRFVYQSEKQLQLGNSLNLKGSVIKNVIPNPFELEDHDNLSSEVLWVGKNIDRKRPEIYLDLCKSLDKYDCVMISGEGDRPDYNREIRQMADDIPNLKFMGPVEYFKTWSFFGQTKVLVLTSSSEGFPNVFLQAWSCSKPVVSLNIDPDNVITDNEMGFVAQNVIELEKYVRLLLDNAQLREDMGRNGKQYISSSHNENKIVKEYQNLFSSLS